MKRDAKTVPEGVKEGMSSDKAITVNKASREQLLSLPGMTEHEVDRIIAERPQGCDEGAAAPDLRSRNMTKSSDRVIAGH